MTATTCIRNAACIVAWDAANRRHAYLMGGDVAFAGDTLSFVGRHYDGAADTTIDGTDLMVMPGLIDLHSHPSTEPFYRGVREEHGVPAMYMSGLYERSVALQPDARRAQGRQAGGVLRDAADRRHQRRRSVRHRRGLDRALRRTAGCACSWHLPTPRRAGNSRMAGR